MMQVWFKNRRAKCRQIQKAGEQQQQVVNSVVKNSSSCVPQLANGNALSGHEPSVKRRSASAGSSADSCGESPVPVQFNCANVAATGTGNSCSRSPTSGVELDRASGDGSAASVSPPGAGSFCRLPASPPSPSSVLLPPARHSCLAASTVWHSPTPHDVISCNGVGYRQAGNVGPARGEVASYGSMALGPNGNGFYSNHGGAALAGSGYGYGDVGGPYAYYGNGVGAMEQWQWTSMTRSYCAPPDHAVSGHVLGGGPPAVQGGPVRYGGMDVGSYLPQSHVRQLSELSDIDIEDRKDWYRFHTL